MGVEIKLINSERHLECIANKNNFFSSFFYVSCTEQQQPEAEKEYENRNQLPQKLDGLTGFS